MMREIKSIIIVVLIIIILGIILHNPQGSTLIINSVGTTITDALNLFNPSTWSNNNRKGSGR